MFRSPQSKRRRAEFSQLVREDGRVLVVLARRLVGDQDAEDLLQGAFIAAWRHFSSLGELRKPRAWLAQFVVHEARNLVRRKYRRQDEADWTEAEPGTSHHEVFSVLQVDLEGRSPTYDPQDLLDRVDGGLRAALLELSDPERTTLLMRVIADLSYKELADLFAVPVGTVMSRLCRARGKLRRHLQASEHELQRPASSAKASGQRGPMP